MAKHNPKTTCSIAICCYSSLCLYKVPLFGVLRYLTIFYAFCQCHDKVANLFTSALLGFK